MSNRSLIELNHDCCPQDADLVAWAKAMQAYMRSGNREELPNGVTLKCQRHHSDPCPVDQPLAFELRHPQLVTVVLRNAKSPDACAPGL